MSRISHKESVKNTLYTKCPTFNGEKEAYPVYKPQLQINPQHPIWYRSNLRILFWYKVRPSNMCPAPSWHPCQAHLRTLNKLWTLTPRLLLWSHCPPQFKSSLLFLASESKFLCLPFPFCNPFTPKLCTSSVTHSFGSTATRL